MTEPIRVFLVDDQALVRAGFSMILNATADMQVVGEAEDGRAAVDALLSTAAPVEADVVLMDLRMPRMGGLEATRLICARPRGPAVLVLTTFDVDEDVLAALRAGASGYLLKDAGPTELLAAIRTVHGGDMVVAPSATKRLVDSFVRAPAGAGAEPQARGGPGAGVRGSRVGLLDRLTDREREVFVAVGRGLSNQEVASALFLAEATVKTHVGALLRKLEQRDRVGLVILAHEVGAV